MNTDIKVNDLLNNHLVDDVINEADYAAEEDIKAETYKQFICKGEHYQYGDLVSQKEFDELSKSHNQTLFCITLKNEKQCEQWFLNQEWCFVPVGAKVMMFWRSPRTGEGEHIMIWKRHFFGEFIVGDASLI